MLKRWLFCQLMSIAMLLSGLSVSTAQTIPHRARLISISAYEDDPYVRESDIKHLNFARFGQDSVGRLTVMGNPVWVQDEAVIYRQNKETGQYVPFAWNPWPETKANEKGNFSFPAEERFPMFNPVRGADGKIVLQDGLQIWTPNDLNLGLTTALKAANDVKNAADVWGGRSILWGKQSGEDEGKLLINAHSFIDFNGFYAPTARQLFLGVVAYRPPGKTDVRMFETATSWEMVAHECGHAVHHALKPNVDLSDQGFRTWAESFGDQMEMWSSLLNPNRVSGLLAETTGSLDQSNALTRMVEAFAAVTGKGNGLRDAFHNKKISDTSDEIHDRSEVFTGAAYRIFLNIYNSLKGQVGMEEAIRQAGQIMGLFLIRAADFTPENRVTLEDVGKAYLKIDRELFRGRYHTLLVDEFTRREIFNSGSELEWDAHEAALPQMFLPWRCPDAEVEKVLEANLVNLNIGPEFGLKLQSVTRTDQLGRMTAPGQVIVRVQLTQGRGEGAKLLDNHGVLIFRSDGTLAEYYSPLASAERKEFMPDPFSQPQAFATLQKAGVYFLEEHGVPLSLVRKPNGQWTVEARVVEGEGLNTWMNVFTPDNPRGERREILVPTVPPGENFSIPRNLFD